MTLIITKKWDLPAGLCSQSGYGIWVEGNLAEELVEWLDHAVSVHNLESGDAILYCPTPDQAVLFGVLARLHNLGLKILALQWFPTPVDILSAVIVDTKNDALGE
jgi:hypothetical protein